MSFAVKIEDVAGARRRLLENSKEVLHALRAYHDLLDLRERKKEVAEELAAVMDELTELTVHLESLLPETSLKGVEEYLPKRPKAAVPAPGDGDAVGAVKAPVATPSAKPAGKRAGAASQKAGAKPKKAPKPRETKAEREKRAKASQVERLERALGSIEERLQQL